MARFARAAGREQLQPQQGELLATLAPQQWHETVHRATEVLIAGSIDIPRIIVVPSGEVSSGFHPFTLDVRRLYLQPSSRELLIQNLHTHAQTTIAAQLGAPPQRCEDYLVHALLEYDDIDYQQHADLLYQLAGQLVQHLRSYLNPSEVQQVLQYQAPLIAKDIHTQMLAHFWESATRYSVTISRGFTQLKPCNYTLDSAPHVHSLRDTLPQPSRIKQLLFGGLQRCLYPLQKFDSDSERRLAVILERDALKWFKPVKGQLQIYYQFNHDQPEYLPDFIVETAQYLLMIEVKARNELDRPEVHAKAAAAQQWCQHASDYHQQQGAKPWCYLLIPHDEINEAKRLEDFLRFRSVQS